MEEAQVLLFEGTHKSRGGSSVLGRHCTRMKTVRGRNGRMVKRCANFSGGNLGTLGAMPFDLEALKGTLLTGAVAVGGAVVAAKGAAYIMPMLKLDPLSMWSWVIQIAIGLIGGYAIGKYAGKTDIGAAVALGPVVVVGLQAVGKYLQPTASSPISGHFGLNAPVNTDQALGATVPGGQFPEWMYQSEFLDQVNKQAPAWAMG